MLYKFPEVIDYILSQALGSQRYDTGGILDHESFVRHQTRLNLKDVIYCVPVPMYHSSGEILLAIYLYCEG